MRKSEAGRKRRKEEMGDMKGDRGNKMKKDERR